MAIDASSNLSCPSSIAELLSGLPGRALFDAAKPENAELASELISRLDRAAHPLLSDYHQLSQTPLMWAAHFDNIPYAKALARHSNLMAQDCNGHSAACFAARNGCAAAAIYFSELVGQGFANAEGASLLMSAAIGGHFGAINALIPSADPARVDKNGNTALMLALGESNRQAALILIPLSPLSTASIIQYTPLCIAAFRGLDQECELILRELHARQTPLPAISQDVFKAVYHAGRAGHHLLESRLQFLASSLAESRALAAATHEPKPDPAAKPARRGL